MASTESGMTESHSTHLVPPQGRTVANPVVLAVDDRLENLIAIAAALEPLAIEVLRARSADEALRAVLAHDVALVLLDVEMPGTDGFAAARLIRTRQKSAAVPIIFLTARDYDREHDLAGYAAGAVDFLYKPVDPDILRAKVRTLLELHHLRDETQLARELLESERRGAAVVASALDCIVSVDSMGRITEFNPAAEHTFGYARSDMLGRQIADVIVPAEYRDAHRAGMARYVRTGEARVLGQRLEMPAMRADGSTFLSELTIVRMPGEGPPAFTAFLRDITASRKAEAALVARDRHHQAILAATNEVIWEIDLATKTVQWSEGLAEQFGESVPHEAATTDGWMRRIHPDDAGRVRSSALATIRGSGTTWSDQYRFQRGNGSYATVLVRGIVLRDADGRPEKMVGSMLDLSERQKLETQLHQSQKMDAVGQLAGGVAHDFNNLLTVITSYAALALQEMLPNDPAREAMEEIAGAADRAAALTKQLLTFSRQNVRRTQVVPLNECIRSEERMLRRLIPEHIVITTALSAEPCTVEVDPQQIGQVLVNLAVNARDAMPDGGTLAIRTSRVELDETFCASHANMRPGSYALLSVSDSGTGMSPETLQHIFEPFYTTKEQGKGTGLGLATVYGIVAQSNGHVWVYSEIGEGTTFKIYLPLIDAAGPVARTPTAAVLRGSEAILVVDDDESVRKVLVRTLRGGGYKVDEATNGRAALALLAAGGPMPGLLLTDVVMPAMGAKDLVPEVRRRAPGTRILLMSGYSTERIDEAEWASGAAFLEKPFTGDELLRRVREVLDRPGSAGAS